MIHGLDFPIPADPAEAKAYLERQIARVEGILARGATRYPSMSRGLREDQLRSLKRQLEQLQEREGQ
jgi:hypothetical protein